MDKPIESIEVHSDHSSPHSEKGLFGPDMNLMLLTWITFFLLLATLYKFAWKPILNALDAREHSIRKSMEDVDHIQKEMEQLDAKCVQLTAETQKKASDIIEQSRKAARDAANIIENKGREEAQISLENALRDIKDETQKAQLKLREESAQIAVELASKLMEENMNSEKNQTLIDRFIKEI